MASVPDDLDKPASDALRAAAARLVQALRAHGDEEYRLTVMKRLSRQLGEDRYPVFLKLLLLIAESEDAQAKQTVADAFGTALRRMDLPAGALSSWGAQAPELPPSLMLTPGLDPTFFGTSPRRQLGPVEYLTVWHLQQTQRTPLSTQAYVGAMTRLLELLNLSPVVRQLYPLKLRSDVQSGMEGTFSRATRDRLLALASAWASGAPAELVARLGSDSARADLPAAR